MNPWWTALLAELQRTGFAELAGAHATARLPVPDRLVGPAITDRLPADAPVRSVELRAHPNHEFSVRVRLRRLALMPPIQLRFRIERQPQLPGSPVLTLLMAPSGLGALAGPALRLLDTLPPGISVEGHRIHVDLETLARRYGVAAFAYLTTLDVSTEDGRFIVTAAAALPPAGV
jgi:hypothetical protein